MRESARERAKEIDRERLRERESVRERKERGEGEERERGERGHWPYTYFHKNTCLTLFNIVTSFSIYVCSRGDNFKHVQDITSTQMHFRNQSCPGSTRSPY